MPQISLGQSRSIDPILTTMAIGIKIPQYVGALAFPPVFCPKRAATIISFGTREEKFLYATRRAPGSNIMRIATGFGDTKVELYQDAIEAELPNENAEESEGVVPLKQRAVYLVKQKLAHRLEYDQLTLLGNFAGYPTTNRLLLTGTNQFSDTSSPIEQLFDTAKDAIVRGIGMMPNTIIYGGLKAYNACKRHPHFKNQFQRAGTRTITAALMSEALDIPNYGIALATWIDPINPTVETNMFDNKIWIGYVPGNGDVQLVSSGNAGSNLNLLSAMNPSINANNATPSFGYTYLRTQARSGGMDTGLAMYPSYFRVSNLLGDSIVWKQRPSSIRARPRVSNLLGDSIVWKLGGLKIETTGTAPSPTCLGTRSYGNTDDRTLKGHRIPSPTCLGTRSYGN
jgi:hypothetical protein